MATTWTFYGMSPGAPTVADLVRGMAQRGHEIVLRLPVVDGDRPLGHAPAPPELQLVGRAWYVMAPERSKGTVSMAIGAPQPDDLRDFEEVAPDPARAGELATVARIALYGGDDALGEPAVHALLDVLDEAFPGGFVLRDRQRRPYTTREVRAVAETPVEHTFHFAARFAMNRAGRQLAQQMVRSNGLLGRLIEVDRHGLRIRPRTVRLTEGDWGVMYAALRRCAEWAVAGQAVVQCDGEWDACFRAIGAARAA